jgi:hypothetical protein
MAAEHNDHKAIGCLARMYMDHKKLDLAEKYFLKAKEIYCLACFYQKQNKLDLASETAFGRKILSQSDRTQ